LIKLFPQHDACRLIDFVGVRVVQGQGQYVSVQSARILGEDPQKLMLSGAWLLFASVIRPHCHLIHTYGSDCIAQKPQEITPLVRQDLWKKSYAAVASRRRGIRKKENKSKLRPLVRRIFCRCR
jgi:hypothetical protein